MPLPCVCAQESLVAAGGVPQLVATLSAQNPAVAERALATLLRLRDHPLAQDAIRWVPLRVNGCRHLGRTRLLCAPLSPRE